MGGLGNIGSMGNMAGNLAQPPPPPAHVGGESLIPASGVGPINPKTEYHVPDIQNQVVNAGIAGIGKFRRHTLKWVEFKKKSNSEQAVLTFSKTTRYFFYS